jgi:hypothetical protein
VNAGPAEPAENRMKWDFFVSYTQSDRPWAEWIAWQLEAAGYRVHLQAWDFVPGSHWAAAMDDGVRHSERTIAVLSRSYLTSVYGAAEWRAAYHADPRGFRRRLVPVRVEDCERPGLLSEVVSFDLFGLDPEAARIRLLEGVSAARDGRAKPAAEPAFPRRAAAGGSRGGTPPDAPHFPGGHGRDGGALPHAGVVGADDDIDAARGDGDGDGAGVFPGPDSDAAPGRGVRGVRRVRGALAQPQNTILLAIVAASAALALLVALLDTQWTPPGGSADDTRHTASPAAGGAPTDRGDPPAAGDAGTCNIPVGDRGGAYQNAFEAVYRAAGGRASAGCPIDSVIIGFAHGVHQNLERGAIHAPDLQRVIYVTEEWLMCMNDISPVKSGAEVAGYMAEDPVNLDGGGLVIELGAPEQWFDPSAVVRRPGAASCIWVKPELWPYYDGVLGGPAGRLGYPRGGAEVCGDGDLRQDFDGGPLIRLRDGRVLTGSDYRAEGRTGC